MSLFDNLQTTPPGTRKGFYLTNWRPERRFIFVQTNQTPTEASREGRIPSMLGSEIDALSVLWGAFERG